MKIVTGDLLKAKEQYIVHQCNCVSVKSAHLAYYMFQAFPYANIYAPRHSRPWNAPLPEGERPGDIVIKGNGEDQRYVLAMLAQYYPGKPRYPDSKRDGYAARQSYFKQCLEKIASVSGIEEVAFPWKIGCGAAGGDWGVYQNMIETILPKSLHVVTYRRPGD